VCTLQILQRLPPHLATRVLERAGLPTWCIHERTRLVRKDSELTWDSSESLHASMVAALFPSIRSLKSLTLECVGAGGDSHQLLHAACKQAALTHLRFSSSGNAKPQARVPLFALLAVQLCSLQTLELHRIVLRWRDLAGLGHLFTGSVSCSLQTLRFSKCTLGALDPLCACQPVMSIPTQQLCTSPSSCPARPCPACRLCGKKWHGCTACAAVAMHCKHRHADVEH
jgi:hypothetical protein